MPHLIHAPDWTPVLAPAALVLMALVRRYAPTLRKRVPDWLVPIAGAVLAALGAHFGLGADAATGAAVGFGATGLWEVGAKVRRDRRLRNNPSGCRSCGRSPRLT